MCGSYKAARMNAVRSSYGIWTEKSEEERLKEYDKLFEKT
jgi:hypothetical protein